jgi:hypothetical protein
MEFFNRMTDLDHLQIPLTDLDLLQNSLTGLDHVQTSRMTELDHDQIS